ncbi:30S ribosomal protein S6 modification protein RimK [Endozoicomonas montiporae]|uniref:30S ribosomal protein S6 modification protein RimK n=2 Tax=Endozoicomonas montiporae TaxID=1027273 RepID=A0A081N2X8_9GAMM|nr:30S ribosomal protein S6 modification protein RimK [Endozoicomonas montiporae]AMO58068.1 hypothetical protein EZMO1_4143 [Endozoicomonas montiporae CL-33]KEQ12801.1 30S ribosomal protein S6 modification protein RimK [Endozoicomonas montiporae]
MPSVKGKLPTIGLLYLDHVMRFFDRSNFRGWPDKIETVVYHWGNDKQRFINEVKRKKIDVLIGNIPATAYETFREIARALPGVTFIPDMDTQFSNKSKENVTHFCEKYNLPAPATRIFYEQDEARAFLSTTRFPKIIKRSYGPSNYGGYYVHKVDSEAEALELLTEKRYYPAYIQDFIPMKADIRVMLIGHKPVCAFWRRPPEGEWLTNTSQGGSMDYMNVPAEALELAVRASKAANAEYWACDIAVNFDDEYRILECATAFAAFPYVRDWIGQYLMWKLSSGTMPGPHIPLYNWEELGKISSSILRTMRYITFGQTTDLQAMTDTCETYDAMDDDGYPVIDTHNRYQEEWPSEQWNRQDNYTPSCRDSYASSRQPDPVQAETRLAEQLADTGIEDTVIPAPIEIEVSEITLEPEPVTVEAPETSPFDLSEQKLVEVLSGARGISQGLALDIINNLGADKVVHALRYEPSQLMTVRNIKARKLAHILKSWENHLQNY